MSCHQNDNTSPGTCRQCGTVCVCTMGAAGKNHYTLVPEYLQYSTLAITKDITHRAHVMQSHLIVTQVPRRTRVKVHTAWGTHRG
eukprot:m.370258 g.370258  ORF g.370258 m.370258 type:complete len:85 (-) comp20858_c0_seq27:1913-2167(-)